MRVLKRGCKLLAAAILKMIEKVVNLFKDIYFLITQTAHYWYKDTWWNIKTWELTESFQNIKLILLGVFAAYFEATAALRGRNIRRTAMSNEMAELNYYDNPFQWAHACWYRELNDINDYGDRLMKKNDIEGYDAEHTDVNATEKPSLLSRLKSWIKAGYFKVKMRIKAFWNAIKKDPIMIIGLILLPFLCIMIPSFVDLFLLACIIYLCLLTVTQVVHILYAPEDFGVTV